MSLHWILSDLASAVDRLTEALALPATSDLERAGCIQYFEFCFELAWKAIRAVGQEQGLEPCLSPKACLRTAFAMGWIGNEAIWLEMLDARNRMSHTYNAKHALTIYNRLNAFLPALAELTQRLRQV